MTDGDWPELMTVAEVAQILRVSKITIYRLIDTGELKSTRIGRSFRVYADSFRQLTQVLAHG